MNQQQFLIVDLATSLNGQVKRIHITRKFVLYFLGTVLVCGLVLFALLSSYLRMTWKVSNYNSLRADFEQLRGRYRELQRVSTQRSEQMASLQTLASEVSLAYGIQKSSPIATSPSSQTYLIPPVKESIEEYNFLKTASLSSLYRIYPRQWQTQTEPSLWPVSGHLRSSFGGRSDPFSGEAGAFHTGVDLDAVTGTPVRATADGIVSGAEYHQGYGKLVVVDHGNGMQTYYAHLSRYNVVSGQAVNRGQVIAFSGGTGRATGPHLHYEVRLHGTAVNPYKYLAKSALTLPTQPVRGDLGL